jgi:hypothetical protein
MDSGLFADAATILRSLAGGAAGAVAAGAFQYVGEDLVERIRGRVPSLRSVAADSDAIEVELLKHSADSELIVLLEELRNAAGLGTIQTIVNAKNVGNVVNGPGAIISQNFS